MTVHVFSAKSGVIFGTIFGEFLRWLFASFCEETSLSTKLRKSSSKWSACSGAYNSVYKDENHSVINEGSRVRPDPVSICEQKLRSLPLRFWINPQNSLHPQSIGMCSNYPLSGFCCNHRRHCFWCSEYFLDYNVGWRVTFCTPWKNVLVTTLYTS